MLLLGKFLQFVVVNRFSLSGHSVGNDLVRLARKIQMMPVSQVPTMRQIQSQNGLAWLKDGRVGLHVGLRSRVRLDIRVFGAKQLLGPVARQILDNVGELAAAVIALPGIPLGILVGEHRTGGLENRLAHEIL